MTTDIRKAFESLSESVLQRWAEIDKSTAEGYWKARDFPAVVEKYLSQYRTVKDDYRIKRDRKKLGELHEQIDQIYARLMGHRTTFSGQTIPLQSFRIKSRWQSLTAPVQMWCAAAGLVMYGKEHLHNTAERLAAAESSKVRWTDWANIHDGGENHPVVIFVRNITTRKDYWRAFRNSWEDIRQHLPRYRTNTTGQLKDFSRDFEAGDPTVLHKIALQEANRWMQINVYDNHQYIERGVRAMPPWVKIGWKPDIIKALGKWMPGVEDWELRINWTKWETPR